MEIVLYCIFTYLIMFGMILEERHLSKNKLTTLSEDYKIIYYSIIIFAPIMIPIMLGTILFIQLDKME